MHKRTTAIILSILLCFGLCSCVPTEDPNPESSATVKIINNIPEFGKTADS